MTLYFNLLRVLTVSQARIICFVVLQFSQNYHELIFNVFIYILENHCGRIHFQKITDHDSTKFAAYHGPFPLNLSKYSGELLCETHMKFFILDYQDVLFVYIKHPFDSIFAQKNTKEIRQIIAVEITLSIYQLLLNNRKNSLRGALPSFAYSIFKPRDICSSL